MFEYSLFLSAENLYFGWIKAEDEEVILKFTGNNNLYSYLYTDKTVKRYLEGKKTDSGRAALAPSYIKTYWSS